VAGGTLWPGANPWRGAENARPLEGASFAVSLDLYRKKRDFRITPEPRGQRARQTGHRYVIQKHAARRLHYDLRLELDGVMKSWAVTRGPSLDPSEKRLAIQVEDHPIDYNKFEGTIPEGYGAGTVMIWDRGRWHPEGDPHRGLKEGRLTFTLDGEKLKGRWHLVRIRAGAKERQEPWLLIKANDEAARRDGAHDVLEEEPLSVASGRTLEEIAGGARVRRARRAATRTHGSRASGPAKGRGKAAPHKARALRQGAAAMAGASEVVLTHPERVYWPDVGVTKADLADYYRKVWPHMAPHMAGRALALVRCPDGTAGECFFQKHVSAGLSAKNLRIVIDRNKRQVVAVDDLQGVLSLVQAGVLEIHVRGAMLDRLDVCDRIVFDLDPGEGVAWRQIVAAAREVRDRLEALRLASFVKLTGGKGLHVVVPIAGADWDSAKAFAGSIAQSMAADAPGLYVAKITKSLREGKILVDYFRNSLEQTSVAAYSTRARAGAPVSVPLGWQELGRTKSGAQYTVLNQMKRLARRRADPWRDIGRLRQSLP
jgi:bifunctional non-homologous end joining protein LigD